MRQRRWVQSAVLLAALVCPSVASADLVPEATGVPSYKLSGTGPSAARAALGTNAPAALRKVHSEGAAFRAGQRRAWFGAFKLASPMRARTVLRGIRSVRVHSTRRATTATAIRPVGRYVAAVTVRVPGRHPQAAKRAAVAFAGMLTTRIRHDTSLTTWQRTLDGIHDDGSITKDVALKAFAIAYGPLPGVALPKAPLGAPDEGTLAILLVARVWDQLSAAQHAAIDRALGVPHDAAGRRARAAADPNLTPDPGYQAQVEGYIAQYRTKIPGVPAIPVKAYLADADFKDSNGGQVLADALTVNADGVWGEGAPAYCRVRVTPAGQKQKGKPFGELILAHEAFHCVQAVLMADWRKRSAWLIEGSADWAATQIYPTTADVGAGPYRDYLTNIDKNLFARSYDASGFWGHIDEVGGPGRLWAKFPLILGTASDPASYVAAGGQEPSFIETWASAAWRFPGAGSAWLQTQTYPLPGFDPALPSKAITGDADMASAPYQTSEYLLSGDPLKPLANVISAVGSLRAGVRTKDFGLVGSDWFCLGECKCPPSKVSSIPPHQDYAESVALALTGGAGPGEGRVVMHEVDEFCDKKEKPVDLPDGPADTNGDPHLTTLDGLHYDFQAAGEFWLVKAPGLQIQARQEPYGKSNTVTVNTQIALLAGGHRVTVAPGASRDDPPLARIDGTVDPLPAGEVKPLGDAFIERGIGGLVEVTWPDGSVVRVRPVGKWGVSATITLADAWRNKVGGLLGDFDGKPANDLVADGGRRVAYHAEASNEWPGVQRYRVREEYRGKFFDALYNDVGDSWRIRQTESLFDYGPGQTTRTFTDRSIPEKPLDPDEIARRKRAAAEKICRARGVTEPGPLADCITDVALTGNPEFADDAVLAQEAAHASWTLLAGGAARNSSVNLLAMPSGDLHVAFRERTGTTTYRIVDVALDAAGVERPAETIDAVDGDVSLLVGPDGALRAQASELTESAPAGIYQYARGASGAWQNLGPVTTSSQAYVSRPQGLFLGDGTLLTVSPRAGVSHVYRNTGDPNPGIAPTADLPDCYSTSPKLARDGVSGAVWLAWIQWDCDQLGVFAVQLDPATGAPMAAPVKVPGSTWVKDGETRFPGTSLDDPLAFTGRPGHPGPYLAFPADDGADVKLWRVGDGTTVTIPRRKNDINAFVQLVADPVDGTMWLAWIESDRLWLQRINADGKPTGTPRPVDPPRGNHAPLLSIHHWDVAARAGALDVFYGFTRDSDTPGELWHASLAP